MSKCGCVSEWCVSIGREHGTNPDRKTKRGELACVFFTRSSVFIFHFFGFKVWAPNCKGNTKD